MNVDEAVTAKLSISGNVFEILVDCEKAIEFKKGKVTDVNDVIVSDDIFKDVKKGEHASNLRKFFNTEDKIEICKRIIKDGEIQLTTEYRNKLRNEKRKQVINLIHRNAINPENNLPHPLTRIESALEQAKVKIDEFKAGEEQIKDIVNKLRSILPIRYEVRIIDLKIGSKHSGKCYGILKQYGNITKDEWLDDGSLNIVIEVPAGLQQDMFDKLNSVTHGEIESKILKTV
ncbi:MAG: ribosome assembly factor SBDS [archaeon]